VQEYWRNCANKMLVKLNKVVIFPQIRHQFFGSSIFIKAYFKLDYFYFKSNYLILYMIQLNRKASQIDRRAKFQRKNYPRAAQMHLAGRVLETPFLDLSLPDN
jgi:hypothetical protein